MQSRCNRGAIEVQTTCKRGANEVNLNLTSMRPRFHLDCTSISLTKTSRTPRRFPAPFPSPSLEACRQDGQVHVRVGYGLPRQAACHLNTEAHPKLVSMRNSCAACCHCTLSKQRSPSYNQLVSSDTLLTPKNSDVE